MKLLELFDKTAPYEWTTFAGQFPAAKFQVEDKEYTVMFVPYSGSFGMGYAQSELQNQFDDIWMGAMQMSSEGGEYQDEDMLTSTGNEFLVMSTSIAIFGEFMAKHQPEVFVVAALMEEERDVVYRKIMGRIAKRIARQGYVPVEEETMSDTPFGAVHAFYLLREDLV